jgi:hypothetical protein
MLKGRDFEGVASGALLLERYFAAVLTAADT